MTYEECKKNGVCPQCRKRKAIEGYFYCQECLDYKRKSAEEYRRRRGAMPRAGIGEKYIACRLEKFCQYGGGNGTCDYYLDTGIRRVPICGVDSECTVFAPISDVAEKEANKIISGAYSEACAGEKAGRKGCPAIKGHEEKALELYKRGMYDTEIGCALGLSTSQIFEWRKSLRLPANTRRRSGERT